MANNSAATMTGGSASMTGNAYHNLTEQEESVELLKIITLAEKVKSGTHQSTSRQPAGETRILASNSAQTTTGAGAGAGAGAEPNGIRAAAAAALPNIDTSINETMTNGNHGMLMSAATNGTTNARPPAKMDAGFQARPGETNASRGKADVQTTIEAPKFVPSFEAPQPIPSWNDGKKQKMPLQPKNTAPKATSPQAARDDRDINGPRNNGSRDGYYDRNKKKDGAELRIPREHIEERSRESLNYEEPSGQRKDYNNGQRRDSSIHMQDASPMSNSGPDYMRRKSISPERRPSGITRKHSDSNMNFSASNARNVDIPAGPRSDRGDDHEQYKRRRGGASNDEWRNGPQDRRNNNGSDGGYPLGPYKNERGRGKFRGNGRGGRGGYANNRYVDDREPYDSRRKDNDWDRRRNSAPRDLYRDNRDGYALPYDDIDDSHRTSPMREDAPVNNIPLGNRDFGARKAVEKPAPTNRERTPPRRAREEASESPNYEPPDAVEPVPVPMVQPPVLSVEMTVPYFIAPQPIRPAESSALEEAAAAQRDEEQVVAATKILTLEQANTEQSLAEPVKQEKRDDGATLQPNFAIPRIPVRDVSRPESPVITLPRPTPTPQPVPITQVDYFPATEDRRRRGNYLTAGPAGYLEASLTRPEMYPAERLVYREEYEYAHARERMAAPRRIYVDAHGRRFSLINDDPYSASYAPPPAPRRFVYEPAPRMVPVSGHRGRSASPLTRMRSRSPQPYGSSRPAEPESRRRSSRSRSPPRASDIQDLPQGYGRNLVQQPQELRPPMYRERPLIYEDYYTQRPMMTRDGRLVAPAPMPAPSLYYEPMDRMPIRYRERPVVMQEPRYYDHPVERAPVGLVPEDEPPAGYERPPVAPPQPAAHFSDEPEHAYYERRPAPPLRRNYQEYAEEYLPPPQRYRERDYSPATYAPPEERRSDPRSGSSRPVPDDFVPQERRESGRGGSYSRPPPEFEPRPRAMPEFERERERGRAPPEFERELEREREREREGQGRGAPPPRQYYR